MKEITNIIDDLSGIAENLFKAGIPSCVWVDGRPNYHWSSTKEEAEIKLGRKMSSNEVTLLSLGRYFGPTPSLNGPLSEKVMSFIWPNGNSGGAGLSWEELAEALDEFVEVEKSIYKGEIR